MSRNGEIVTVTDVSIVTVTDVSSAGGDTFAPGSLPCYLSAHGR
jgi:hypothetical protein